MSLQPKKPVDFWLFTVTMALLVIGVLMVFDASYARAGQDGYTGRDSLYFVKRQAAFAVVGLALMFAVIRLRYWRLKAFALVFLLIAIIGLCCVFIPGVGVTVNGARRSIQLPGLRIQPSEIAKLALIIYLAATLSMRGREVRDWRRGLAPLVIPVGVVVLLIVKEDLGTAMVFTATALVMAYMAGARGRHLAVAGLVCVALAIVAIKVEPYRFARIRAWPDPFKYYSTFGYQICQSLIGLGSGGPFGVGVCEGKLKLFYLPAEHTDFILSVLGEEAGLIGTLAVTGLFLFFAARGFRIAYNTKECFGRLLAGGVSAMICGQALLNMYVITCTVPATGVPLPFISYGGSSLTLNLLSVGVLLAISKHSGPVESYEYEASANRRRYRRSRVSGDIHRRSRAGSVS